MRARAWVLGCIVAGACGDGGSGADADLTIPDASDRTDATPGECNPVAGEPALSMQTVGDLFESPVAISAPRGDPRVFVVEQGGTIRFIEEGLPRDPAFLDITGLTNGGGERGLLGLAFHPDYGANGRFYVYYTREQDGSIQIDEFRASQADPNLADPDSRKPIINVPHSQNSNHNGGAIAFGTDGNLYFGVGDGGGGGDPDDNAEDIEAMLGKIHRIDVDGGDPYRAAPGNPFLGVAGADTIYAYGLRNPWRLTFDRSTGDMYIGDVGQGEWEEIDVLPPGSEGANLGWDHFEGDAQYECPGGGCDESGRTFPVYVYEHGGAQKSVTGGYVYRGCKMPGHRGRYFFADYYGGTFSLRWEGEAQVDARGEDGLEMAGLSSFGEDSDGEIYIAGHWDQTIRKIVPAQ